MSNYNSDFDMGIYEIEKNIEDSVPQKKRKINWKNM